MIPKGSGFLPSVSLQRLQMMMRTERNRKPHLRLLAAIHRKQGWTLERSAAALGKPITTLHDWLVRFDEYGFDRLQDTKQPGRPPVLTVKQRREFVRNLERGPPYNPNGLWTSKEVKNLLKHKYKVEFVNQHVWRLLTSLGFSMQRPRKRHYKQPNEEELSRFKKKRGDKHATTERKGLLWARKMKRPSVSSRSLHVAGPDGAVIPL